MPSFVDQYKTIFLGVVSHKFVLKSSKILNRIFWVTEYLFKDLECKIWSTNTKPFFWKSETKLQTLEKLSPYIGVSKKFAFKTLNTLNRIFWPMEYWFKSWECQIWSTNTKAFFWESETNFGTLQKVSPYTGGSHKFISKSPQDINQIFWVIKYWFKALECQIWTTNTKPFFWVSEAKLETLQEFSSSIGVSYKFLLKSVKT